MTRRRALVSVLLLLGGASACASIVGDFTKGEEAPDGSGGDASLPDGATADGSSPSDAGRDGAAPPAVLTCKFQPGSVLQLASFARPSQDVPDNIFLLGPTPTNGTAYVVVPGGGTMSNQGGDVFRYAANQTSPNVLDIPAPPGQIYAAHRTADGIVLLSMDQNIPGNPGHSQLVVFKLSESVTDGGIPVWQRIPIGPMDPIQGNTCRQLATFLVVDSLKDDYIVALSYNPAPSGCAGNIDPPLLFVARTGANGGPATFVKWDVPQLDGGTATLDFQRDSIVLDPGTEKVYLFADPSGGGPTQGVGPIVFSSPSSIPPGGATAQRMNLGSGSNFAGGLGYISSPSLGGIDVGILGGDLALVAPSLFVGNAPANEVATLPISSAYQTTVVDNIESLPVDKGRSHWHAFSGGENLLLIGRNDLKGGNGVNVYWFDNAGNLRVRQAATDAGPEHSALLQDHVVVGADVTFNGPPVGSPPILGDLLIAVTEQTATDGGVHWFSLTQYHTTCTPP